MEGCHVKAFQEKFSCYIQSKFSTAVTNGTTALQLALDALNIGKGDTIIIQAFSFVASINVAERIGANVLLCDIDLQTFNIDTQKLSSLLESSHNIKAIMPVSLFGLAANLSEIKQLAKMKNIAILEDAACALGSTILNKPTTHFTDISTFSFHPRKIITTGEGGMLSTNNEELHDKIVQLAHHGLNKKGEYALPGFNAQLTDMQAAIGSCQMDKLPALLEKRKKNCCLI